MDASSQKANQNPSRSFILASGSPRRKQLLKKITIRKHHQDSSPDSPDKIEDKLNIYKNIFDSHLR